MSCHSAMEYAPVRLTNDGPSYPCPVNVLHEQTTRNYRQVTPEQAKALLDKRRLAWLASECCRITGTISMSASPRQWLREHRPAVCKVCHRPCVCAV